MIIPIIAGFSDKNITFELPEVEHINKDGRLPRMDITISGGQSSITVLLCEKETTKADIELEFEFPFIVLKNRVRHSSYNAWKALLHNHVTRNPVFGVCDQVRPKPVCSATETS